MRVWMPRVAVIVLGAAILVGAFVGALARCSHDPNHDIDQEKARAAAGRVHATPPPGAIMGPDRGG